MWKQNRERFDSVLELREAINELPLLRAPRTGIDPRRTVVACHRDDLDEAINFYRRQSSSLPELYVLEVPQEHDHPIHDFAELKPEMDIQLYFHQSPRPGAGVGPYPRLVSALQRLGICRYCFEQYCVKYFWNKKPVMPSDTDWDTILRFVNALCDADSQYTYMAVCRSRLEAEPGYIPLAGYKQYFHPHVSVKQGDIVCEGGIDDGESTLRFFEAMNRQGKIYAFEPVPSNCETLQATFAPYDGVQLEPQALWKNTGHVLLSGNSSNASFTVDAGERQGTCPCTSIDDYFSTRHPPTVIKLDVEGAEPEVLTGAQKTLANYSPKLMVSIYHSRQGKQDWITIPRMLMQDAPQYTLFCGHHRPWYAETIVYAY